MVGLELTPGNEACCLPHRSQVSLSLRCPWFGAPAACWVTLEVVPEPSYRPLSLSRRVGFFGPSDRSNEGERAEMILPLHGKETQTPETLWLAQSVAFAALPAQVVWPGLWFGERRLQLGQISLAPTGAHSSRCWAHFSMAWREEKSHHLCSLGDTAAGSGLLVGSPSHGTEVVDQEGHDTGLRIVPLSSAVSVRGD